MGLFAGLCLDFSDPPPAAPATPAEAPLMGNYAATGPYGVCGVIWRGEGRYVGHLSNGKMIELPKLE